MKKIFITQLLAFAAMNINAQLVVDSLGKVGIGTQSPLGLLSVEGGESGGTAIYCNANGLTGLKIRNYGTQTGCLYGGDLLVRNGTANSCGINSYVIGNANLSASHSVVGVVGCAGRAQTSIGLMGCRSGNATKYAGVYGTVGNQVTFSVFPDMYAGFFYGKVRVTDGIYATVLSPTASASPAGQGGATILSDRGESVTDKLSQVQTLQFLRFNPTKAEDTEETFTPALTDAGIESLSPDEIKAFKETAKKEPAHSLPPIQYGLDAKQLKAVYPELVYEDENGNISINYVEMVPLLVQSINELSAKVAVLEGTSAKKSKASAVTTGIEDNVSEFDTVRMDQNKPNPFSESTVITLNIPEKTQTANIFIYDMSGRQVQSIPVSERGETDITVYAHDLTAGMYIYTLVVEGKVEVTRRMIVTE